MIEYFITSGARRKVLIYLVNHPGEEFHLRELSRKIGQPAPIIKRELDQLDRMGFILSWAKGNQRRFKVNRNFVLWPEIKSLMDKCQTLSMPPKISTAYTLKEVTRKRKGWRTRTREVVEAYGRGLKRRRPRHPAEARMLEEFS